MRSLWRGALTFGLVHIPVRLYAATEDREIHFRWLHEVCGSPIRYQKVCPSCQREVTDEELVKAYEETPGEFIVVREEELAALRPPSSRAISIVDFVAMAEVDPIYFDRSYYLEPESGAAKPYALLRTAMEKTGRVAVAKFVLRQKEQLALVRLFGPALALVTLCYPDEVRPVTALAGLPGDVALSQREVDLAVALIEQLTSPFEPTRYEDTYTQALREMIAAKRAGRRDVARVPALAPVPGVEELLAALEASLRAAEERPKGTDGASQIRTDGAQRVAEAAGVVAGGPEAQPSSRRRRPTPRKGRSTDGAQSGAPADGATVTDGAGRLSRREGKA